MSKRRRVIDDDQPPQLLVLPGQLKSELQQRIELGNGLLGSLRAAIDEALFHDARTQLRAWHDYNVELLRRRFNNSAVAQEYDPQVPIVAFGGPTPWKADRDDLADDTERRIQRLDSILNRIDLMAGPAPVTPPGQRAAHAQAVGTQIFVVHGRDTARKQEVARFLERLTGREVLILNELPNHGQTLMEKLERYAEQAAYTVVILTGDDVGGLKGSDESQKPRARQNVILELGFFYGRLGRANVSVLFEEGVEAPSDMSGVAYAALDLAGGWKFDLAKDLRAAGVDADLNRA
jgi:predicted nucleotide-binding protein